MRFIIALLLLVLVVGGIVGFNMFRDRAIEQRRLILRKVSDERVVSKLHFSLIVDLAHDGFYQRGLTFTIFPDKCDAFPAGDGEGDIIEYSMIAVFFAEPFNDHRVIS